MKRNNKTWIKQLSESYIRQTLNEMALTARGLEHVQSAGQQARDMFPREHPARAHLASYHELLRTHPTKIFNGEGEHIGNIVHEALPGQEEALAASRAETEAEVAEHDALLHRSAYMADEAMIDHATKTGEILPNSFRPNPEHARAGRSARPSYDTPITQRLSGLYPGPIV